METAVFGGGCFWCTEAIFKSLEGVEKVLPGYAGGGVPNPTYMQVSSGTTGHAEVIYIEYDPAKIAYADLLTVFFGIAFLVPGIIGAIRNIFILLTSQK